VGAKVAAAVAVAVAAGRVEGAGGGVA